MKSEKAIKTEIELISTYSPSSNVDTHHELVQHEFSKMVPPMSPNDYARLREDLREHGLKVPVLLYEGKVLDGWHRYQICTELRIPIRTQEYNGDCPMFHAFSLNVAGRHLLPTQLAALAVELLPSLEKEAKARQLAALKQNKDKASARGVKDDTTGSGAAGEEAPSRKGKSRVILSKPPSFPVEPAPTPDDDALYGIAESEKALADGRTSPELRAVYLSWPMRLTGIYGNLDFAPVFPACGPGRRQRAQLLFAFF
jgi:hypothetical protein